MSPSRGPRAVALSLNLLLVLVCGSNASLAFQRLLPPSTITYRNIVARTQRGSIHLRNSSGALSSSSLLMSSSSSWSSSMIGGSAGEVVGATGNIGSFFLSCGGGRLAAVPRHGVAAGSLSPSGTPIYLCVPASARHLVEVCPEREGDVVFVGNGIPHQRKQTHVIPHFGVVQEGGSPRLSSSDSPPVPTFVYGPHAQQVQELLSSVQVPVEAISSWHGIRQVAIRKILWASSLWLLCHSSDPPKDIATVHDQDHDHLQALLREMLPAAQRIARDDNDRENGSANNHHPSEAFLSSVEDVMKYFRSYSDSLRSTTIPSLSLALKEWKDRNGLFFASSLTSTDASQNNLHAQLLRTVLLRQQPQTQQIKDILHDIDGTPRQESSSTTAQLDSVQHSTTCGTMTFVTRPAAEALRPRPREIVIVGGGILGTFLAYSIAKRFAGLEEDNDVKITVYDRGTPKGDNVVTTATEGSWGWLNSNDKQPFSYHLFNCLGLSLWKRCPEWHHLGVHWTGSLIKRTRASAARNRQRLNGSYAMEGPLSPERLATLEPLLARHTDKQEGDDVDDDAEFFFFPDEGHVSPWRATQEVRRRAQEKYGVSFVDSFQVTDILKLDDQSAQQPQGIRFRHLSQDDQEGQVQEEESGVHHASLVVVTAGTDCCRLLQGKLPLQPQGPSFLAYFPPPPEQVLQRIVVDTVTKCHFLHRPDEGIVMCGGHLQWGGTGGKGNGEKDELEGDISETFAAEKGVELVRAAQHVAPHVVTPDSSKSPRRVTAARRPIPRDGVSAVGYNGGSSSCVYVAVTHSAVTLGPLLGELAAMEIVEGVQCELLEPYRPERFSSEKNEKNHQDEE